MNVCSELSVPGGSDRRNISGGDNGACGRGGSLIWGVDETVAVVAGVRACRRPLRWRSVGSGDLVASAREKTSWGLQRLRQAKSMHCTDDDGRMSVQGFLTIRDRIEGSSIARRFGLQSGLETVGGSRRKARFWDAA